MAPELTSQREAGGKRCGHHATDRAAAAELMPSTA